MQAGDRAQAVQANANPTHQHRTTHNNATRRSGFRRNLRSKSCNTIEPWVREMCNGFQPYYLAFPRTPYGRYIRFYDSKFFSQFW